MLRKLILLVLLFSAASCSRNDTGPHADSPAAREEPPVAAAPEVDQPPPKPAWYAEYQQMVDVLPLSEEQKANLQEAFEAREKAVSKWQEEKGAEFAQFEARMKQAAKSGDMARFRQAKAKAEILRDELRELTASHQGHIQEVLFPEYRLKWASHQLAEKLLDLMKPLKLSDRQVERIREITTSAVQRTTDEPNPMAAATLQSEQFIEGTVLTREQRQIFQELKKRNPLRSLN